ncbi:hypothetical protein V8C42DRAFT_328559 [Trichoderma barbatum]
MRSLVIACGRDRRWHDKHGARERVWIWSILRLQAASTANRFVYSGGSAMDQVFYVLHVLRIVAAPYCTLGPSGRCSLLFASMTSTPFDFDNGPSTATAVSGSTAPAAASSQGRLGRPGYDSPPAQAVRLRKEACPAGLLADNGGFKGGLAAVCQLTEQIHLPSPARLWRHSSAAWPAQWNLGLTDL